MTLDELDKDMAIAAVLAFRATSPDRRLAGAEWLQQLTGQLVEALKAEQPQPEQPAEKTPNPGEGWRTLEFREIIQEGDEYFSPRLRTWFKSKDIGGRAYCFPYRRRIQPEPEKARYYYKPGNQYVRKIVDGKVFAKCTIEKSEWFEDSPYNTPELIGIKSDEITREEAIQIGGEP